MANSFNYYCSHQNFCHPFCYKRHMRSASRLIKAVRQVNSILMKKTNDYVYEMCPVSLVTY